jgi:hypothetical protein
MVTQAQGLAAGQQAGDERSVVELFRELQALQLQPLPGGRRVAEVGHGLRLSRRRLRGRQRLAGEERDQLHVAALGGVLQRRAVHAVARLAVGAQLQQRRGRAGLAADGGRDQRRLPVPVPLVHGGPGRDEVADDVRVVALHGRHHRRRLLGRAWGQRSAQLHQGAHRVQVALPRGVSQGRAEEAGRRARVGARAHQRADGIHVPAAGRHQQRRPFVGGGRAGAAARGQRRLQPLQVAHGGGDEDFLVGGAHLSSLAGVPAPVKSRGRFRYCRVSSSSSTR